MRRITERLQELQQKFISEKLPDSYRILHGRGRTFTGLEFVTIDYFQPIIFVTLFAEPAPEWIKKFLDAVIPLMLPAADTLILQHRYLPAAPSEIVVGTLPAHPLARRRGMIFNLTLTEQQNNGFFLDIEPGRLWVEKHAKNKRILNLFAYTCAFSVVAVAAGAQKVVNVDMSDAALNRGRTNHLINGLDKKLSEFLPENILKSWGRIKRRGPYDVVIIDPPSYQKGSFIAEKDYPKVIRRLPELMPGGGRILACLNSPTLDPDFLLQNFREHCPLAQFDERLPTNESFPDINPQQQLKLLTFNLPSSEAAI